jgi:ABC-type uncharacterized transport system permease subunit
VPFLSNVIFTTKYTKVTTKYTIRLGVSIVNFVEYLGAFVLKKVTSRIPDVLSARIIKKISVPFLSNVIFNTKYSKVTTKYTIRLGVSIVNFVEYLGAFVLKIVTSRIPDVLSARIIENQRAIPQQCHL